MLPNLDDYRPSVSGKFKYPVYGGGYGLVLEVRTENEGVGDMRLGEVHLNIGPGDALAAKIEMEAEQHGG